MTPPSSPSAAANTGARTPIVESQDAGFVYYTRYLTGRRCPSCAVRR
ncbi:MAG: hypothetical protein ACT4RN_18870 [Pseudonocardia sp.]